MSCSGYASKPATTGRRSSAAVPGAPGRPAARSAGPDRLSGRDAAERRPQAGDHARRGIEYRVLAGPLLQQPDRLVAESGVRGQRATQPGAEEADQAARNGVHGGAPHEYAEDERAGDVDGEGTPREHRVVPGLYRTVGQVPQRRTDRRAEHDEQNGHRVRPAYRMTSTGSRITRPSATSSSSSGRKARMRSSRSTMMTAIGR